jgi:hypothetical protein
MYKEALEYEKRNYNLLRKICNDDKDPRLAKSSALLKHYTSKAVESRKQAATMKDDFLPASVKKKAVEQKS